MIEIFTTRAPEETWQLAASLLPRMTDGAVLALHGGLGAGKTTFTQGLAMAMGVKGPVTSPTFALLGEYAGASQRLAHFDLYRLSSDAELLDIGFLEYASPPNIVVVEWPERAEGLIPANAWHFWFEECGEAGARRVKVAAPDKPVISSVWRCPRRV